MGSYYAGLLFNEKDSLSHHGILGQKWGVRRYQNKDGTLTEEGKIRYGRKDGDSSIQKKLFSKNNTTDKETEVEYLAFEFQDDPYVKKNLRNIMTKGNGRAITKLARGLAKKNKSNIKLYAKYQGELEKQGVSYNDHDLVEKIRREHPDYARIDRETDKARDALTKLISASVERGDFDSFFSNNIPVSLRDDAYVDKDTKEPMTRIVDGRKAVLALFLDNEFNESGEYRGYGLDLRPVYLDFEEFRKTSTLP